MGRAWQDLKRESIQQAVIRLMCREGLKSVTMERVAQEVGIAKGTVYLHYHDKQELLDAVKDAALTPMVDEMNQIRLRFPSPEVGDDRVKAPGRLPVLSRGPVDGVDNDWRGSWHLFLHLQCARPRSRAPQEPERSIYY